MSLRKSSVSACAPMKQFSVIARRRHPLVRQIRAAESLWAAVCPSDPDVRTMNLLTPSQPLRSTGPSRRIAARIGGISLGATTVANGPALLADEQQRDFLITDPICDLEFDVAFGGRFDSAPGELVFDSRGLWKLFRNSEGFCFRLTTDFIGTLPYKQALVAPDFKSGRIEMSREYFAVGEPVNPLEYPLDELLWIHRLSLGEGVEIHGCGVIAPEGRGLLLTGHSGAGKSTSSRLWSRHDGARVLSDDRIILRRERYRIWMYGTPGTATQESPRPIARRWMEFMFSLTASAMKYGRSAAPPRQRNFSRAVSCRITRRMPSLSFWSFSARLQIAFLAPNFHLCRI